MLEVPFRLAMHLTPIPQESRWIMRVFFVRTIPPWRSHLEVCKLHFPVSSHHVPKTFCNEIKIWIEVNCCLPKIHFKVAGMSTNVKTDNCRGIYYKNGNPIPSCQCWNMHHSLPQEWMGIPLQWTSLVRCLIRTLYNFKYHPLPWESMVIPFPWTPLVRCLIHAPSCFPDVFVVPFSQSHPIPHTWSPILSR